MTTATSVGITARILSDKKKMHSPEGVSILSAAVIDDILAIILLAIVVGVVESEQPSTSHHAELVIPNPTRKANAKPAKSTTAQPP